MSPLSRNSGSEDLEGTQLSGSRASRASWHATAPSWLTLGIPVGRLQPSCWDGGARNGTMWHGACSSCLSLAPALGGIWACRGATKNGGSWGWRDPGIRASQGHWQLPGSALGTYTPCVIGPVPEHKDSAGLPSLWAMPARARVGLEQGSTSRELGPPSRGT